MGKLSISGPLVQEQEVFDACQEAIEEFAEEHPNSIRMVAIADWGNGIEIQIEYEDEYFHRLNDKLIESAFSVLAESMVPQIPSDFLVPSLTVDILTQIKA